jgi:putative hydroxymethylpyrimidine transport system substrate-binding protein
MRVSARVLAPVASAALLAGCGNGAPANETIDTSVAHEPPARLQHIHLGIGGRPDADVSGVLLGAGRGYFKDEGIGLYWTTPFSPVESIPYLVNGLIQISIAPEPAVLMARQRGARIVAIGDLVSKPTSALIWLKGSKVENVADLKGGTIGITGLHYEFLLLKSILARAHLKLSDVKVRTYPYRLVPSLAKGRADAILGESNIEGLELRARGLEPVITPVTRLGIPPYSQMVLIARASLLRKSSESIRPLMAALARGTTAVAEAPGAAVEEVDTQATLAGRYRLKSTAAGIAATLPLLSRTNRLDPGQWTGFAVWMHEHGWLSKPVHISNLVTIAYLARTQR